MAAVRMYCQIVPPKPKPPTENEKAQKALKDAERLQKRAQIHSQNMANVRQNTEKLEKEEKSVKYEIICGELRKIDSNPTAAQMAMQNFQLKTVDQDPKKALKLKRHFFNIVLPTVTPCNQRFSGRCWMFAGLNILRPYFINKYNLKPNFELSQSYLFFWHYYEQYNAMMNLFHFEASSMSDDEKAAYLEKPLHDGGNWITFRRLVTKYGIVPGDSDGETWPSSHSSEMNSILCAMLQKDLCEIQSKDDKKFKEYRKEALKRVLKMLCSWMGHPPTGPIQLLAYTKKNKCVNVSFDTPLVMFQEADQPYKISNHVQLIIDPRHNQDQWFTTQHQELRGIQELLLNEQDTQNVANYIKKSITMGIGVWFACNISVNVSTVLQGMDNGLYRPDIFIDYDLAMEKVDRINWGRARCNHAMLITGICEDKGKITAFQIQNSWGATGPHQGYYKMTREWFDQYVHTVVIHDDILENLPPAENTTELKYYDFFG